MNERQNIIVKDDIIVKLKSEIGNEKSKMSSLTKEKLDIESNAADLKKTIIEISEENNNPH
jgi:hypothetical protein